MRRTSSYPSDLTDGQWQVIAPHLPADQPGRRGRPRIWPLRVIVEAILYLDRTGCPWRYLPDSFPPWPTVYGYFAAWRDDGTLAAVHDALRARVRAAAGRDGEPTAAIIDSQSVRAADTVPRASRGWDNAKKVNGRKRHIAVDAMGLLLAVVITAASVQDRDAARPLLWNLHRASRHIRLIWADAVYTGKLSAWAASMKMTLCIVARRQPHTFEVLPRRWVVERTFAWISKHRRTVRDYETLPASHEAMILWAMIALMTRRLTQPAELSDAHLVKIGANGPAAVARRPAVHADVAALEADRISEVSAGGDDSMLHVHGTGAGEAASDPAHGVGHGLVPLLDGSPRAKRVMSSEAAQELIMGPRSPFSMDAMAASCCSTALANAWSIMSPHPPVLVAMGQAAVRVWGLDPNICHFLAAASTHAARIGGHETGPRPHFAWHAATAMSPCSRNPAQHGRPMTRGGPLGHVV